MQECNCDEHIVVGGNLPAHMDHLLEETSEVQVLELSETRHASVLFILLFRCPYADVLLFIRKQNLLALRTVLRQYPLRCRHPLVPFPMLILISVSVARYHNDCVLLLKLFSPRCGTRVRARFIEPATMRSYSYCICRNIVKIR